MASLLTPLWDSPPPAAWGPEAAVALSPLRVQTDRHTQRVGHSPACFGGGRKQLWEQESAVGAEKWSLTQGSAILWVHWPTAAAQGLLRHQSKGEAKVSVPFLHPSSPRLQRGSTTVQVKSTWGSRAQSYALSFPLRQGLLFKRKHGSAMAGKARGVWVIPGQWWFCLSFHAFWLYVPPALLGWEFQAPVIHYWRTQSEGQTDLLFAFFPPPPPIIKNLYQQQCHSAWVFLPYSGLNNSSKIQPLPPVRKITEK